MRIIAFIFFIFLSIATKSQSLYSTQHLGMDDGLLQNTVWAIEQDYAQRIWLGSPSGIQLYNGYDIQTYQAISETVTKLHHRDSSMFVLTTNGLYKIDERSLQYSKYSFKTNDYYQSHFLDSQIVITDRINQNPIHLSYDLKEILDVHTSYPATNSFTFQLGSVTIRGSENGTFYLNPDTNYITQNYCIKYLKYNTHRAFIASHGGLMELQLQKDHSISVQKHFTQYRVEDIYKDQNQNLWVGTAENGIFMIHRNALHTEFFKKENALHLPLSCWGFLTQKNNLYTVTAEGVHAIDVHTNSDDILHITKEIHCFSGNSNAHFMLIGTSKNGIYKLESGKIQHVYFNAQQALDNTIIKIISNENGFLACSKKSFIQLDHQGHFLSTHPYEFDPPRTYSMYFTKSDSGYLVSTTSGIYELDFDLNIQNAVKKDHAKVISMTAAFKGSTWATSMDAGLLRVESDSLQIIPFPDRQLLTLSPQQNTLWISSVTSIYQYTDQFIRPFDYINGFPIKEYNQTACFQDKNQNVYFAGVGGVVKFHPDSLKFFPQNPNVILKKDSKVLSPTQKVELAFDQSELVLQVEPIMLSDQNYFEILVQFRNQKIPIQQPNPITLSAPYGDSEIQVLVIDKVHQTTTTISYPVFRAFPFWQETWFIFTCLIITVLLILGSYSFINYLKTKKLLREEKENHKLMQERLRISKELHDNIGARITHIISSLDIEMYKTETSSSIETINAFARETMTQLRETIWAVSDQTIFFSEFVLRVGQYIHQIDPMTETHISLVEHIQADFELHPVETINLYRIIQEAIHNTLKYAQASTISVDINSKSSETKITISDDGIGFDASRLKGGNGLHNMKSRAQEVNAKFTIHSSNEGTIITIVLNR
ncbi:sensor histidine kinase [bacterium SCSIO 12643]|nr:sensor histidine kinase [bacterium SCSIO 12643]